jgi:hypothetical protein
MSVALLFCRLHETETVLRRQKVKRQILIKPRCRQSNQTTPAAMTFIDLVNSVMDEAGDDAQLVNAVIADLVQSGKIKWARPRTINSKIRRVRWT